MTAATDHELSVEKLTGMTPERQREFVALGWRYDIWGNCSYRPNDLF